MQRLGNRLLDVIICQGELIGFEALLVIHDLWLLDGGILLGAQYLGCIGRDERVLLDEGVTHLLERIQLIGDGLSHGSQLLGFLYVLSHPVMVLNRLATASAEDLVGVDLLLVLDLAATWLLVRLSISFWDGFLLGDLDRLPRILRYRTPLFLALLLNNETR